MQVSLIYLEIINAAIIIMQVTSIVGAILRSSRITRSSFDSSQQVQLLICHFPSLLITS